ncbi:hypothetical protein [Enterococcus faecium]|uniref:hypothetical protein n=1 Tax=Enterococcus faecium TaxID=1352 RepID=UPI000CF7402E|nr:hypothetical protein [Enterococcus faecium]MTD04692.1 hypothetical protein [Enterococcus faecium]PQB38255.1 hypothetical protein CUN28_05270 [Enterococcus faecium]
MDKKEERVDKLKVLENSPFDLRKGTFLKYQEKKKVKLISELAYQLANVPQLVEELTKSRMKILDISKELAEKIVNGELVFSRKETTGEAVGILREAKTGKLFSQIPIKDMPVELGATIATVGLSVKLQEISYKLEVLNSKINRVNRNFDLNRYAEVCSAEDKFKLAILTKNQEIKRLLLVEVLSQATNAKNLLLNQLYESKRQLELDENNNNWLSETITIKKKAEQAASLAQDALDNLYYMKDAFNFQIMSLIELGEYEALSYTVSDFKDLILRDFSDEDALFLDGHLPPTSTNPFKYLSEEVIESSTGIIEFLNCNEDLLKVDFFPSDIVRVKEDINESEYL